MRCPYCGQDSDKVVDTRSRNEGRAIRRRRLCLKCNRRFITVEEIEDKTISVIKADKRREPFDQKKLIRGIEIACIKRPVSVEDIEDMVDKIEAELQSDFVKEIESRIIGELVMKYLQEMDAVAYVRFASVYRKFEDKEEFLNELRRLENQSDSEKTKE